MSGFKSALAAARIYGGSISGATITGGTITGALIVGNTVETATTGQRVVITSGSGDRVLLYSGNANETTPGSVQVGVIAPGGIPSAIFTQLNGPDVGTGHAALQMGVSLNTHIPAATLSADTLDVYDHAFGATAAVTIHGNLTTTGTLTAGAATVTSLNAGSGTIQTTGTLSAGAATVTSLNAGSGTIQTTGQVQAGSVIVTGAATLDTPATDGGSYGGRGYPLGAAAAVARLTANTAVNATATPVDTGLDLTVTLYAGRKYRISALAQPYSSVATDIAAVAIHDGAGGANLCQAILPLGLANVSFTASPWVVLDAVASSAVAGTSILAGTHTFRLYLNRQAGTGTLNLAGTTGAPCQLLCEDIGTAG